MSDAIHNLQVALSLETSKFTSSVKSVNQHIKDLDTKFKNASQVSKDFENSFTGLSTKMDYLKGRITATQEKIKLLTTEQDNNSEKLKLATAAYENAKNTWQESIQKLEQLKASGEATTEEISRQEKEVAKNEKAMLGAERAYLSASNQQKTLARQIENSTASITKMESILEETSQKFNNLSNKTETTDDKLKKLNSSVPLLESKMKLLSSTLGTNATKTEKLTVEQTNLQSKLEITGQKATLLGTKIKELETKQSALKTAMTLTKESINAVEKELTQAKLEYGENSEEVIKLQTKLLGLKDTYLNLNNSIEASKNELNRFQTELNETQAELNQTENSLKTTSKNLTNLPWQETSEKLTKIGDKLQKVGEGIKTAGSTITTRLTLPIIAFGASSVKIAAEFEAQMSTVAAISGLTGQSLQNITDKSREMGAATTFSALEAAQAMEYMALAGWKETQMLEGIEPILRAAEAGKMDLAIASDLVTDSMGGMGIATNELLPYLDKVASTSANANTNVEQLLNAFINAGPTTTRLKIPVEEAAAVLGVLANNGLKGESAGTKLNAMLTRMTAQSKIARGAWEKIGVQIYDSEGKFRGLTTILSETKDKFDALNDQDQSEFLKNAVGTFNSTEFSNLLRSTTGELQSLTATVKDSDGALYNMAETMQDNAVGKTKNMESALEELQIVVGNKLMPVFVRVVEKITELADKFGDLTSEEQDAIIKKALLVAAIGPLLLVLGNLTVAVGGLFKTFGTLTKGFGFLKSVAAGTATTTAGASSTIFASGGVIAKAAAAITSPWALVGIAVAGSIAYAVKETKNLEKFTEESTEKTRKHVANLEEDYKKSLDSISTNINKLTDKEIKFISDEDKILLQKDLKDIENIINGGAGNAEKEMKEYINRVIKNLPEMSEEMQQSTAEGIRLMLETFAKDGKIAVDKAEELWNSINDKLKKPLDGLDLGNIRESLKMQDLFKDFSKELAESKGWGDYSKIMGDWDRTVVALGNMVRASKDIKAENVPAYVDNLIQSMRNSKVPAELMSYAFSKSMYSALQAFGPDGATAYFKEFVSELGLGAEDVETTIGNMALSYKNLPDEQKKALVTTMTDLLEHYGYIDDMTLGFNENMLNQNSELWSSIVGQYLAGTENAQTQVSAFCTDAVEEIRAMSDENKVKAVEWLTTYLDKMVETGALTVNEARNMATKINDELGVEVETKVTINPDRFYTGFKKAKTDVETLDASKATPEILANTNIFEQNNKATLEALKTTDETKAIPEIKADNTDALKKIEAVQTKIDNLPNKRTIDIVVNEKRKTIFDSFLGGLTGTQNQNLDLGVDSFNTMTQDLFRNMPNINSEYITAGNYYNRATSPVSKNDSSNKIEKLLLDAVNKIANAKEYTQNITINSAKHLSPREIAQQTRLAGQQLLKLY